MCSSTPFGRARAVQDSERQHLHYRRNLMMNRIAQRVADGETVTFRPTGNSMVPLIQSRDEVVVAPVDTTRLAVGDIVLTRVAGSVYLHLIKGIEPSKGRVQIGNNRGRINGWTSLDRVYGIAVSVGGKDRASAREKVAKPSGGGSTSDS
jgi:hypothetical protein